MCVCLCVCVCTQVVDERDVLSVGLGGSVLAVYPHTQTPKDTHTGQAAAVAQGQDRPPAGPALFYLLPYVPHDAPKEVRFVCMQTSRFAVHCQVKNVHASRTRCCAYACMHLCAVVPALTQHTWHAICVCVCVRMCVCVCVGDMEEGQGH